MSNIELFSNLQCIDLSKTFASIKNTWAASRHISKYMRHIMFHNKQWRILDVNYFAGCPVPCAYKHTRAIREHGGLRTKDAKCSVFYSKMQPFSRSSNGVYTSNWREYRLRTKVQVFISQNQYTMFLILPLFQVAPHACLHSGNWRERWIEYKRWYRFAHLLASYKFLFHSIYQILEFFLREHPQ